MRAVLVACRTCGHTVPGTPSLVPGWHIAPHDVLPGVRCDGHHHTDHRYQSTQ